MVEVSEAQRGTPAEHPGIELGRLLEDLSISDSTVADEGGLSRPLVSQITNGGRRITPTSAGKIVRVVSSSLAPDDKRRDPMYWVRRQREHDFWCDGEKVQEQASLASSSVGGR